MKLRWIMVFALALVAALLVSRFRDGREVEREDVSAAGSSASPQSISKPAAGSDAPLIVEPELRSERSVAENVAPPPADDQPPHAGIRLYGFVRAGRGDESLVPIVNLVLTDRMGEVQRTTVDAKCAYSITGLAPGRYWIVCGAGEWGKTQRTIDLNAADRDRRLDLELQFGIDLVVEVVDRAGHPLPELPLVAVATLDAPGEWFDEDFIGRSDSIGVGTWIPRHRFGESDHDVILGQIHSGIPPPLFVSLLHRQRVLATRHVEGEAQSVRFVVDPDDRLLQPSSIRFRLIDAQTRQPLPEASFQIIGAGPMYTGKTMPDGTFHGEAWPGWMCVRVKHKDYERSEFVARADAGMETNFGDIALESPVFVSGHVVGGRSPEPPAQNRGATRAQGGDVDELIFNSNAVTLSFSQIDSPLPFQGTLAVAAIAEDGSFRIGGLSRRRYRLDYRDPNDPSVRQTFVVDTRLGSLEDVRLVLRKCVPLVVSASDDRWPLVRFDVINDEGVKVVSTRLSNPEPSKIPLVPGRYEIEVRIGNAIEGPRRVITIANDPVELPLP